MAPQFTNAGYAGRVPGAGFNAGGQYPRGTILSPSGEPFPRRFDDYPIPHVMTFSGLVNTAWRVHMHGGHSWALQHNRQSAMAMRKDETLMTLLGERARWAMVRPWHISVPNDKDPREKYLKDGLQKAVEMIPYFRKLVYGLERDGSWYGRQGAQLRYRWQEISLPPPQGGKVVQVMADSAPTTRRPDERRRVLTTAHTANDDGFMFVNGDKIGHSFANEPYVLVNAAATDLPPGLPLWWSTLGRAVPLRGWERERFIRHRFVEGCMDADYFEPQAADQVNGIGLRDMCYFWDFIRKEFVASLMDGIETFGIGGMRVFTYDQANDASFKAVSALAHANPHRTAILIPMELANRGGAVPPVFEIHESHFAGAELVKYLLGYVDRAHERLFIGQSMSGGVGRGEGSSHGAGMGGSNWAEMAMETKTDVEESDAVGLAETLTYDLVRIIQKYSFPEYTEIPAEFKWGKEEKKPDVKLDAAEKLFNMGYEVKAEEAGDAGGFSMAQPGDVVLSKRRMEEQAAERQVNTAKALEPKEPKSKE